MTPDGVRPRRTARQAVLDAAAVVLAKSPGASLSEVAKAAGIGRATLYRHFPSREALIKELSLEAIQACDEAVRPVFAGAGSAAEMLQGMLEALIEVGDRFHFLAVESHVTDPEVAVEVERQARGLAEFVEYAQAEGLFAADLPASWIATTIDTLIWAAWSEVASGSVAPRQAATLAYRTLTLGLSTAQA